MLSQHVVVQGRRRTRPAIYQHSTERDGLGARAMTSARVGSAGPVGVDSVSDTTPSVLWSGSAR